MQRFHVVFRQEGRERPLENPIVEATSWGPAYRKAAAKAKAAGYLKRGIQNTSLNLTRLKSLGAANALTKEPEKE